MGSELAELQRLKASADRVAVLHEELRAEQDRRDELVIAARDQGVAWSVIARAARLSPTRCTAIVSAAA